MKYLTQVFSIGLWALSCVCTFAYSLKDASQTEFSFQKPPRVATLVPAVSEIIFALGAQDQLIANSVFCKYPDASVDKPKIGSFLNPDYEKILDLAPDIFILPYLSDDRIEAKLKSLGIKCFVLNKEGVENISADVRMIGALLAKNNEAKKLSDKIEEAIKGNNSCKINAQNHLSENSKSKKALFMFGQMAAGKNSFVGDALEACGLQNCAAEIGRPWPILSKEFVISANPDIVFIEFENESKREKILQSYRKSPFWASSNAFKNNKVFLVHRDLVTIPGPRIVELLKLMRGCIEK